MYDVHPLQIKKAMLLNHNQNLYPFDDHAFDTVYICATFFVVLTRCAIVKFFVANHNEFVVCMYDQYDHPVKLYAPFRFPLLDRDGNVDPNHVKPTHVFVYIDQSFIMYPVVSQRLRLLSKFIIKTSPLS